jgi:DNA-binding PadR family transcriptional regulator
MTIEKRLPQWEEAYKKGLLSFWILLLLHDQWRYAYEMTAEIATLSDNTMIADEKSIYRALKRFEENGIIRSELRESDIGPQRRYYTLSPMGKRLLSQFIERNILIFQRPEISDRINSVLSS